MFNETHKRKKTKHTNQRGDRKDKEQQYNRTCTNTSKFSLATVLNRAFNIIKRNCLCLLTVRIFFDLVLNFLIVQNCFNEVGN